MSFKFADLRFYFILLVFIVSIGTFFLSPKYNFLVNARENSLIVSEKGNKSPKPTPTPTPNSQIWEEKWIDLNAIDNNWSVVTQKCYSLNVIGILDFTCESGGIVSKQKWNKNYPITVEGSVTAKNSVPDAQGEKVYWAGMTLFDQNGSGGNERYGELAAQYKVPPFQSYGQSSVVALTDETCLVNGCIKVIKNSPPETTHTFKIVYKSDKGKFKYFYYVDGASNPNHTVNANLVYNPNIFLLCVATGVGSSTPARANCEFGPIKVTGVLAS